MDTIRWHALILALSGIAPGCLVVDDDNNLNETREDNAAIVICPEYLSSCGPDCGNGICELGELSTCPEDCGGPPPAPSIQWSNWLDRDNPSGTGDWETLTDFTISQVGCALPAHVNAQTLSGVPWGGTGEQLAVSPDVGLICLNANQTDGYCLDYKVQFGCATPNWSALTQSWHEDYTILSGNIEGFVPTSVSVPSSRYIESMTFASNGSFSILRPAPNDLHYWAYGTWTRSGNIITVNIYDSHLSTNIQELYEVAELSTSSFRFRRL